MRIQQAFSKSRVHNSKLRLAPRPRQGFTLTELLMVVAIISILASMVFIMFSAGIDFTERLQAKTNGAVARAKSATGPKVIKSGPVLLTDRQIVVFNNSVTDAQAEVNRLASTYNMQVARVYSSTIKGMTMRTDSYGLMKIRTDPAVAYVQPEKKFRAISQTVPAGIRRIHAPFNKTQPPGIPSSVVIGGPINLSPTPVATQKPVAVTDTGIDATHPDLNVVFSINFSSDPDPTDVEGHGTHVAGTIGARNNGFGVVGVNPGVPLWAVKVLDSFGFGSDGDILAAIDFLAQNSSKVQVVNMSLGGPFSQAFNDGITQAVRKGLVIVVSAGNEGIPAEFHSPASCPEAITVAAMCDTDGLPGGLGPKGEFDDPDDTMTIFSNWGDLVDFIAPGESVLSTLPGNSYGIKSGTSMSSPHVAGVASLILEKATILPGPSGPINLPSVQPGVTPTNPGGLTVSAQVQQKMMASVTEYISGILGDTRKYPMINAAGY